MTPLLRGVLAALVIEIAAVLIGVVLWHIAASVVR